MLGIREFYDRRIRRCWAPPPRLTVAEWADENRMISSESAAEPGRWHTDRAPYQRAIMDAVTQPDIEKIVVMSSSQVGKSEILNNIIGYYIDLDPCPLLLIEPSVEDAEDYSKRRIAPMIRDTKSLAEKVADEKSRNSGNTILSKMFPGGVLSMRGANAPSGLASKPIRVLLCDEVDRYPSSAGTEGNPVKLAEKRTITFWNRKKIYVSSPGIKGRQGGIEDEYESGTRERWCMRCPHCGKPVFVGMAGITYREEKDDKGNHHVEGIAFRCPECAQEAGELTWKAQPGEWIADNPGAKKVRSFHLNAFASPWYGWAEIVDDYLAAKDDADKYKVFVNTTLGEPFEVKGEIENEEFLTRRCEDYGAELPDGVLFLTAAVDTQDDWLEYEIVGWGRGEESWSIRHGRIPGKPDVPELWEELDAVLRATYSFADGVGLTISCTFVDSGGHYTSNVYDYCKHRERERVFAIKGMGGTGIPLINKITRTKKEKAFLILLGVDEGKTGIMNDLKVAQPGPRYCHFPKGDGYDAAYFRGLIAERLVPHKKNGMTNLAWEKISADARNEPFDIRNYARAAFKLANPKLDEFERSLRVARGEPEQRRQPTPAPPRVIHSRYI